MRILPQIVPREEKSIEAYTIEVRNQTYLKYSVRFVNTSSIISIILTHMSAKDIVRNSHLKFVGICNKMFVLLCVVSILLVHKISMCR